LRYSGNLGQGAGTHRAKLSPRGPSLCRAPAGRSPAPSPSSCPFPGADTAFIAANFGAGSRRRKTSPAGSGSPREAPTAQHTAYTRPLRFLPPTPRFRARSPRQTSPFSLLCFLPKTRSSPQTPLPRRRVTCAATRGPAPKGAGFHPGSVGLRLPRDTHGRVVHPHWGAPHPHPHPLG